MTAPTTLGIDPIAVQEQARNNYNSATQPSTFDSILNTTSYLSSALGPVAVESVYAASGSQPASIVAAAVNASANPYSSASLSTGYSSSGIGTSGSSNYVTGGYTGSAYADTGSTEMSSNVEDILSQSYTNQAYLIAVQGEMGNIQTTTTSISNALNVKHSAMKSVINNFRVG